MLGGRCAFPLRLKPGSTRPAYRRPRRDAARVIGAGRRRRRFAATRNGIKGYFCGPVFPCAALFCWASLGVSWSVDPVSETKGDRAIVRRIGRLGSHFALQRAASDPTPAENSTGVGGGGHTSPNRPRTSRSHAPAWGRLFERSASVRAMPRRAMALSGARRCTPVAPSCRQKHHATPAAVGLWANVEKPGFCVPPDFRGRARDLFCADENTARSSQSGASSIDDFVHLGHHLCDRSNRLICYR